MTLLALFAAFLFGGALATLMVGALAAAGRDDAERAAFKRGWDAAVVQFALDGAKDGGGE